MIRYLQIHPLLLGASLYPGLHTQVKEPSLFTHSCSQPPLSVKHSFTSLKEFKVMMNKYIKVIQKYHQYESKDKTKVWLYAKPLCTNSMHSNVLKLTQCQRVILVSAKEPLYQHCRGLHSSKHSPSHEQPSFRFRAKPLLQLHV